MISLFELCLLKILCFTLKQGRQGVRNEQEGQCLFFFLIEVLFASDLFFNNCPHGGNPAKYGTSLSPALETQTLFLTSECTLQRDPKSMLRPSICSPAILPSTFPILDAQNDRQLRVLFMIHWCAGSQFPSTQKKALAVSITQAHSPHPP